MLSLKVCGGLVARYCSFILSYSFAIIIVRLLLSVSLGCPIFLPVLIEKKDFIVPELCAPNTLKDNSKVWFFPLSNQHFNCCNSLSNSCILPRYYIFKQPAQWTPSSLACSYHRTSSRNKKNGNPFSFTCVIFVGRLTKLILFLYFHNFIIDLKML